jgi:superfamily II DNA/RNA helicase
VQPPASAGRRRSPLPTGRTKKLLHRPRLRCRDDSTRFAGTKASRSGLSQPNTPRRWRGEHWSTDISTTFSDLGASAEVVSHFANRGITSAFPIQEQAIPPALEGRDVSGKAPTGSGKTLAFGIPLAHRVTRAKPGRPRALVLAPTRELAAQIEGELAPLLALRRRSVASFYGGVGFGPQLKALRRGVDVAVACPGRLADLVRRGNLALDDVEIVVIDEADRMADMGFLPEVKRILDQVRPDRQTLLFSATLDGDVNVIVQRYQRDPVTCDVIATEEHVDRTSHHFVDAERDHRVRLTAELVEKHGATVVFCRTKHGADRVATQLTRAGVSAVAIHGDRSQSQRERALAAFAGHRVQALVATDVAARGIHVDNVGCVVHFDPPADAKDYVHRSGRTGRAGSDGVVVSFVTDVDRAKVRQMRKVLGMPVFEARSSQAESRPDSRPSNGARRRRPQPIAEARRPVPAGGGRRRRRP